MAQRTCAHCSDEYQPTTSRQKYCSKRCGREASRAKPGSPCSLDQCTRKAVARGLCCLHWKREHGKRTTYPITCTMCGAQHQSTRPDGKFCSDHCKTEHYRLTRSTKCKLPADHPVMVLIAEACKPKPKPVIEDQRTARECPGCACWFSPLFKSAGHMTYCSERCARREQARRRRAREHNTTSDWRWSDFMRIARKFNYCCAYCGEKPDRLDPDHVIPLSRGGSDSVSNLLPTCLMCNSDKCARMLDEWAAWRAERGKPARTTSWMPGDTRYSHLTDALLLATA